MAETYLTPTFQNAVKPPAPVVNPAAPAAPGASAAAPAPAQTGGEQYQTDTFKKATGGQQTTGAADQTGGAPGQGWGIDWSKRGGQVTMPQSAQDWLTRYGNESLMGTIPGLRTQAEAAGQRLGPAAAGSADFAGAATSPSQLLNLLGGPELAGAVHGGLSSYNAQPNWIPTQAGAEKIAADTALGAATGGLARGAAAATPLLTKGVVSGGIPVAAGTLGHLLFGQWDPYREAAHLGAEALATLGGHEALSQAGNWAASKVDNPVVRQAVKSLIMGGGSMARDFGGPSMYDQWIPGQ